MDFIELLLGYLDGLIASRCLFAMILMPSYIG